MKAWSEALAEALGSYHIELDLEAMALVGGKKRYPIAKLCDEGVAEDMFRAELLSAAAGFAAAIKNAGRTMPDESLLQGAQALLPRVERPRFVEAFNEVVRGQGLPEDEELYTQPLAEDLIVVFVQDRGWKLTYVSKGRVEVWDTTDDTVHSAGRSNLYNHGEIDYRGDSVSLKDAYDASRVLLMNDVFYDRFQEGFCEVAVPSRDLLLVGNTGKQMDPELVKKYFDEAEYPLSKKVYRFQNARLLS